MFDEKQPGQSSPTGQQGSSNQPMNELPKSGQPVVMPKPRNFEPGTEDIFADTDKMADKVAQAARASQMSAPVGPPEPLTELPDDIDEERPGMGKKFVSLLIAIVVLVGIGAGGYYAYSKFFADKDALLPNINLINDFNTNINQEPEANVNNQAEQPPAESPNANENVNQPGGGENVIPPIIKDSDKDGLTDEEEITYGTDPNEPDSDGDGLFDKEEIKIYKTNPLDPDTDNDGYLDGLEVKGGYNPDGAGKLLEANFQ